MDSIQSWYEKANVKNSKKLTNKQSVRKKMVLFWYLKTFGVGLPLKIGQFDHNGNRI